MQARYLKLKIVFFIITESLFFVVFQIFLCKDISILTESLFFVVLQIFLCKDFSILTESLFLVVFQIFLCKDFFILTETLFFIVFQQGTVGRFMAYTHLVMTKLLKLKIDFFLLKIFLS